MESKEQILDKAYQYIHWLTTPNEAFSNMAVCPFIEPEIKKDQLYIDIWNPSQMAFMDMMSRYYDSQKRSALFVCQNSQDIDWEQVERKPIQSIGEARGKATEPYTCDVHVAKPQRGKWQSGGVRPGWTPASLPAPVQEQDEQQT